METIGYLFSIGIGIILGLLGGGGSILSIPILVYCFHVDAVLASAYSLFIVGVTSLVGAVPKYRDHLVSIRAGLLFGLPSVLSIFVTRKWIIPAVPDIIFQSNSLVLTKRLLILGLFAILMIVTSITMIAGQQEKIREEREPNLSLGILEGVLIGFLTGMVGAGGGFLIIPALVMLTGLPFKTAVGTSLFVIAVNALTGFLGDVINYNMNWPFLLLLTALAILGIFIGSSLTHKTSNSKLRRSFGWFVLLVGIWIFFKEVFTV